MNTTLTNKLLKFFLPVLIIPTILVLSFFYVYLTHIIEDDIIDISKNIIYESNSHIQNTNNIEDTLYKHIREVKKNFPTITIIDKNLKVIASKEGMNESYSKYNDILHKYIQEALSTKNITLFHDKKNKFMAQPLLGDDNEIIAFAICDYENILSKKITFATQTFIFISVIIILITFISIILTVIFAFNITNPIKLLIKGTKKVSDGDLSHKISISSDDEVGILVNSFNDMVDKLKLSTIVFENTKEAIVITDASANIIDVNIAFSEMTGYSKDDVLGKKTSILKSGQHDDKFYKELWDTLLSDGSWRGNIWNRKKNGDIYPVLIRISTLKDEYGEIKNFIAISSDITELKENEERLDFLAHHDSLTGLPNRLHMSIRLEHSINICKRLGSYTAICFIDLDNFKTVNDMYGHDVGDELLKETTKRLKSMLRADDTLARIGGDEFVLIYQNIKNPDEITGIAEKIVQSIQKPFEIFGNQCLIGSSIGISIYPDDGATADTLLKKADIAMYKAKDSGKNRFKYYNKEMEPLSH